MDWIRNNLANIIIGGSLVVVLFFLVRQWVKNIRAGGSATGCSGCNGCAMQKSCPSAQASKGKPIHRKI